MNNGKVLVLVGAGIAAGALAGILYAPAKGKKTRKRILAKGKNYSGILKKQYFEDKKIGQYEEEVLQYAQII